MRWMKWIMMATVGCLPALAFADEPAKPKKPDNEPKSGFTIEVQTDGGKPHKIVLGGGGDNKEAVKALEELARHFLAPHSGPGKDGTPIVLEVKDVRFEIDADHPGQSFHISTHGTHAKGAYLGVSTSEPPPVLRKQLGLQEGMGLVIDAVIPDSPAAKAGLKEFDVVQKLDDQWIVNYEQFTVLIRGHKPGDEVKLGVIHEGKPVVLNAKLIEHEIQTAGWQGAEHEIRARLEQMLNRPEFHRAVVKPPAPQKKSEDSDQKK